MTATAPNAHLLAELKLRLQRDLRPTRSAFPPWPDDETLARLVLEGGQPALARIATLYAQREKSIRLAREDRFTHGWEWPCWDRADRHLPARPWDPPAPDGSRRPSTQYRLALVLGGNRASKSEWAVKRCVQTLIQFPNTRIIFLCQKLETSRQVQQSYIWTYLPPPIKALNFTNDPARKYYVRYQQATGFTNERFVLPNGSEAVFLSYTQNPSDYEGIQVGSPEVPGAVGWYADESLPLEWLQLLTTRSSTYDATGLWTFTALEGMTPALKEAIGEGRILESQPAPALADRQNVPGIPVGHMPTVQEGARPNIIVIYFHTAENPLGGYERVLADCEGKPTYFRERKLYGYVRDVKGKVFTHFGAWNIVPHDQIPPDGARYMHADPAAARNWFILWALVDRQGVVWVYDEWPSVAELGEWAVATTRNPTEAGGRGWDGDPGPAQEPCGYGIAQYKLLMLRREGNPWEPIPAGAKPATAATPRLRPAGHVIVRRTVDRRAGPSPIPNQLGDTTCIYDDLNAPQSDPRTGDIVAPALDFQLAGGPGLEDDGLELIKTALWVDREKPFDPIRNYPKLFVSDRCQNLIWALSNYTGRDGNKGACKDPIDCLRDLYTSGLDYVTETTFGSKGGGSY